MISLDSSIRYLQKKVLKKHNGYIDRSKFTLLSFLFVLVLYYRQRGAASEAYNDTDDDFHFVKTYICSLFKGCDYSFKKNLRAEKQAIVEHTPKSFIKDITAGYIENNSKGYLRDI